MPEEKCKRRTYSKSLGAHLALEHAEAVQKQQAEEHVACRVEEELVREDAPKMRKARGGIYKGGGEGKVVLGAGERQANRGSHRDQ